MSEVGSEDQELNAAYDDWLRAIAGANAAFERMVKVEITRGGDPLERSQFNERMERLSRRLGELTNTEELQLDDTSLGIYGRSSHNLYVKKHQ